MAKQQNSLKQGNFRRAISLLNGQDHVGVFIESMACVATQILVETTTIGKLESDKESVSSDSVKKLIDSEINTHKVQIARLNAELTDIESALRAVNVSVISKVGVDFKQLVKKAFDSYTCFDGLDYDTDSIKGILKDTLKRYLTTNQQPAEQEPDQPTDN